MEGQNQNPLTNDGCVPTEAEIQEIIVSVEDPETSGSVHLDSFLPHVADIISEYK
uniref:Uncharacterized protein n=1 Tax=Rhodnius prolixus TaxID=13249 RepID=T1HBH8_RHOPR